MEVVTTIQTTITERGQISVPAAIRKQFHLKPGMGMMWIVRENAIYLMPVPEDPIEAFCRGNSKISSADREKWERLDRESERRREELLMGIGKKK